MKAYKIFKTILPSSLRRWLRNRQVRFDLSALRRSARVNVNDYGESRGQCIDRYYIEKFLAACAADVRGHVLDFHDDSYARKFGGAKVSQVDVLHLTADNPQATIVADLARGEQIPSETYDCILCTQVLQYVYYLRAAVRTLYRILKPGGVLLVTTPGIQKIDHVDMEAEGEYWRFTSLSLPRLVEEVFPKDQVNVKTYGNVLAAVAFLQGLAVEDLRPADLEHQDPDYEVSIALRAVKPKTTQAQ